jgi:hypothetical protein
VQLSVFSLGFFVEVLKVHQFRAAKLELLDTLRRAPVISLASAIPPRRVLSLIAC